MIASLIETGARQGTQGRHLRPGAERLPRVRRVPRARGHRLDLAQPRQLPRRAARRRRRGGGRGAHLALIARATAPRRGRVPAPPREPSSPGAWSRGSRRWFRHSMGDHDALTLRPDRRARHRRRHIALGAIVAEARERGERFGLFAALYRRTTQEVRRALRDGAFHTPPGSSGSTWSSRPLPAGVRRLPGRAAHHGSLDARVRARPSPATSR